MVPKTTTSHLLAKESPRGSGDALDLVAHQLGDERPADVEHDGDAEEEDSNTDAKVGQASLSSLGAILKLHPSLLQLHFMQPYQFC